MSNEQHIGNVDFGFIRYANCWEDAGILLEALDPGKGDRVLSVASAGDNSFAMLTRDVEQVIAVDLNPVQLYLCALKKAAFTLDTHEEFLQFLGFSECADRMKFYNRIAAQLPEDARRYWDANPVILQNGVINAGKFERYFAYFRRRILPWVHSRSDVRDLFETKTGEQQERFYNETWNTWRWRLFFRIFFSKYVMGKYGRDPEFLKQVNLSVPGYIFLKAENELKQEKAQHNYFLRHILSGHWGQNLPVYARVEHFDAIRSRIDRIVFMQGYAEQALDQYAGVSVLNLSNIFEYMPADIFSETAKKLVEKTAPGARFAYWNLMVPRRISGLLSDAVHYERATSQHLSAADNGFFYNQFILDRKI